MRLSRILLLCVIVTLCLAAMLGLVAVLAVNVVNWRLIVTDLAISLFSLTCLGASIPRHRNAWRFCTPGTFITGSVGLVLSLVAIWDLVDYPFSSLLDRGWGLCLLWSIALPVMSLLAMTQFSNWVRWARRVTLTLIGVLAIQASLAIILRMGSDIGARVMIANAILATLGIVSLPILQKLYGTKNTPDPVSTKLEMEIICPRCASHQTITVGDSACGNCHLKFHLEIEEPRCAGCGYLLYKLTSSRCPECGRAIPMVQPPTRPAEAANEAAGTAGQAIPGI